MSRPCLALTREPSPSIVDCELTFVERQSLSFDALLLQHRAYCAALRKLGLELIVLPPIADLPDAVFVEDTAVIVDEIAVLTAPPPPRYAEVAAIAPDIARLRPTVSVQAPATLEGGDVLRVGRTCFVGLSIRSNPEGVAALHAALRPYGYDVVGVPMSGCLHLKTAVTALDDQTLLLNPDWVAPSAFADYRVLTVAPEEPWGANVLRIGATLLMNDSCPQTLALVEQAGYTVVPVAISELMKAEAGLTCMSLLF